MSLEKPNWNDRQDKELYNKLFYKTPYKELTEEEKKFVTTMYHMEEYMTGNG